jgi:hypothetical protein
MNAIAMIGRCMQRQEQSFGTYARLVQCGRCGEPSLYSYSCAACIIKAQRG